MLSIVDKVFKRLKIRIIFVKIKFIDKPIYILTQSSNTLPLPRFFYNNEDTNFKFFRYS